MKRQSKNWLEWTVFGASLLLVLFVVGYLAYVGWTLERTPPELEISLGEPTRQLDGYLLKVEVHNRGTRTAEGILIEVALSKAGQTVEVGQFELPFLPGGARRSGHVVFASDPAAADAIRARPLGFRVP